MHAAYRQHESAGGEDHLEAFWQTNNSIKRSVCRLKGTGVESFAFCHPVMAPRTGDEGAKAPAADTEPWQTSLASGHGRTYAGLVLQLIPDRAATSLA
jgi:hypothetical protein